MRQDPSPEIMRDGAAGVGGHWRMVLAHADAGGFAGNDPGTDQRMHAVEHRQRACRLIDPVVSPEPGLARAEQPHLGAFPPMHRLFDAWPRDAVALERS